MNLRLQYALHVVFDCSAGTNKGIPGLNRRSDDFSQGVHDACRRSGVRNAAQTPCRVRLVSRRPLPTSQCPVKSMLPYAWAWVVNGANFLKGRQTRFINHFHHFQTLLRLHCLGKVLAVLKILYLRPELGAFAVL